MGFLLQIRMSWRQLEVRAFERVSVLVWCCGPGCWCCELAEHAFETGGGADRMLVPLPVLSANVHCRDRVPVLVSSWLCALWRCRKLAVQAACIWGGVFTIFSVTFFNGRWGGEGGEVIGPLTETSDALEQKFRTIRLQALTRVECALGPAPPFFYSAHPLHGLQVPRVGCSWQGAP